MGTLTTTDILCTLRDSLSRIRIRGMVQLRRIKLAPPGHSRREVAAILLQRATPAQYRI